MNEHSADGSRLPGRVDEKRQFLALYRTFLFRIVDLELLSASGDIRNLLGQFAALLAAYSFVLALLTTSRFALSTAAHSKLVVGAWGLEEFYFSTTITVVAIFAVLSWNALIPDRRDALVLDPLPVRSRTILGAKWGSVVTALAITIIAVNVFTGLSFPFFIVPCDGLLGAIRCLFAYWTTLALAGAFGFGFILALQNIAATLLSYQLFQRVSGVLQLSVLFAALALLFLTPPLANPQQISSPANQHVLAFLPSFWFLGLFQVLNGTDNAALTRLAGCAVFNLGVVWFVPLCTAVLSHRRNVRRTVEQPDISPGASVGAFPKLASFLSSRVLVDPIDRAIVLFSARTQARSRQHRLVLAVYIGIALAISLAYAKSLLYGSSNERWEQPGVPLIITGFVTLFFALVGTRAVFALPFALPANWIFRITALRRPASYFSAVRKTLLTVAAAPILLLCGFGYFSLWPNRPALAHLLVLLLVAILLVQILLRKFRKIPFACSYLPGKSNLRLKLGISGMAFLFAVDAGAHIEYWSMQKPARYLTVMALLIVGAVWATRRTIAFAGAPYNAIQFEDVPSADIFALDLRRDSACETESDYLDAVSSPARRSFASTAKLFLFGLVLVIAVGLAYEHYGEWRDQKSFPRIGRSVNIGDRSLNLYCAGSGSPTVVLDSGGGIPGYGWKLVQSDLAHVTRTCWYDRAGYGWSDPAPRARSSADIARDLHLLLHHAKIAPPYVLVGHSLGGFNVRVFAAQYQTEVVGMALVDSADEYEDPRLLPKSMRSPARYFPQSLVPAMGELVRFGVHMGVRRFFDDGLKASDGKLSLQDSLVVHSLQLQSKAFDASLFEGSCRQETITQVRAVRNLGSVPLIVLTGAKKPHVELEDQNEAELLDRFMDYRVHVTQAHLATLSTHGRQIVLKDVGHGIPTEAPVAVVNAVREVLR